MEASLVTLGGRPLTEVPPIASQLADRYRIERELGRGGMATVYLARDLKHERDVALKVLRPELAHALGPERFLREIRLTAQLHHPHILPVFDSGEVQPPDGQAGGAPVLWYTTPLVGGGSLRERLGGSGPLPLAEALTISRNVAAALAHAHRQGIIHRDVKPENILIEDGEALLADFGIARLTPLAPSGSQATALTETGLSVGTPDYMAPEQLAGGREVDGRADIYALGVVTFEMLTGRRPFADLVGRFRAEGASTRETRRDVPEAVDRAIQRALAPDAADRFATAGEFAQALEAVGVPAPAGRSVSSSRRGAFAAGLVALAAVAAIAWRLLPHPPPPAATPTLATLPFRVADPALAVWREGLVDLYSYALDGAGGLRAIGARTALRRWHDAVGPDGDGDDAAVRRVGRALGARYVLNGSVVPLGSQVKLVAEARDLATDSLYRAEASGPPDSLAALAGRTATDLLRQIVRANARLVSGGPFATQSLEALKAFLTGEHAFREARYPDAIAQYTRAVQADSTFVLAQFRKSAADGWTSSPHSPGGVPDAVLNALPRLGRRDSLMVRGSWELSLGIAPAISSFETLTREYPDDPEGWYLLGDTYYHIGMVHGVPEERADSAFRRAIAMDSSFAPAYLHLVENAFGRNDSAEARALVHALIRFDSTSPKTAGLQVALGLAFGTRTEREQARARLARLGPDALIPAKHALNLNPDLGEYTDTIARAVSSNPHFDFGSRAQGLGGQGIVARFRGHFGESRQHDSIMAALVDSLNPAEIPRPSAVMPVMALSRITLAGLPVPRDWMTRWSPAGLRDVDGYQYTFGLGSLAMHRWADVEAAATHLERQADTTFAGRADLAGMVRRDNIRDSFAAMARQLRAWADWLRAPSPASLRRFEAMTDSLRRWDTKVNLADYVLGTAFLAEGDLDRAERHMLVPQRWVAGWNSELIVPREYYLGRIAEARGDRALAREHYARFVRWWRDCDPELQPMWQDGKDRLARVSGEPREP